MLYIKRLYLCICTNKSKLFKGNKSMGSPYSIFNFFFS